MKWCSQGKSTLYNSEFSVVHFHFTEIRSTGLLYRLLTIVHVDCRL